MKRVILALSLGVCVASAWGNVFQMDSRGDAVVEVDKVGGEYKISCTFSPQTKFDPAINAKLNDAKGNSLCKKGIARHLGVGSNDLFSVSGLYSAAPVKSKGGKLRYSFAVPVSGCKVEVGAAKPKMSPPQVTKNVPVATNVVPKAQVPSVTTNAAPQKVVVPAVAPNSAPAEVKTTKTVRSSSYMSVVKYKEVNGQRSIVSRREYRGSDFRSRQEFDQLCAREFARVRALSEENFRAVRNFVKQ